MKHRITALILGILFLCTLCAAPTAAIDVRGLMKTEFYTLDDSDTVLPYRIYLPEGVEWDADGAYSGKTDAIDTLLIWLHDEDLRGDDNTTHISDEDKNVLLQTALTSLSEHCIVIAPQCPMGETWDSVSDTLDALLLSVRSALQKGGIYTQTRVLLGGIGMGASYGYTLIGTKKNTLPIDAAFLVGGTCKGQSSNYDKFTSTALYAFISANENDDANAVRALVDAVSQKTDKPFSATEYEGAGYELWLPAFAESEIINTFLNIKEVPEQETTAPTTESETETEALTAPVVTEPRDTSAVTDTQSEGATQGTEQMPDGNTASMQLVLIAAAIVLVIVLICLMRNEKNTKKRKNPKNRK